MKKFLALTTSLCTFVCALGFGGAAAAFADTDGADGLQYYPDTFDRVPEFSSLEDYAVGDDGKILFLQKNVISEYGNERVVTYSNSNAPIKSLYFENGEFYYGTDDGKTYALKNFNTDNPEENFISTTETEDILLKNKHNYYKVEGVYYFFDKNDTTGSPVALDFSNLKRYGETVYAVKDNVLYTLDGAQGAEVTVKNFELTEKIRVGNAFAALKASASQDGLQFVRLANDAYATEVNLDKLTEESLTFDAGDTVKIKVADTPTALLLYTAGDDAQGLSIVAVNGKSYLIHPKDTESITRHPLKDTEYSEGTATEGYIYSAPHESAGTRIAPLPYGTSVKIIKELKMTEAPELNHDFFYVEYKVDEDTTYTGYVRSKLISTFTFNEDPPVKTPDPEATTEDLIKPVVLVLIVLLLIAIAAGYLIYIGTSDKRKKKNETAATDNENKDK